MKPSIILAVNYNSYYKKKVVNNIVETFDLNNSVELKYNIKKLIYKSFDEIIKFLDADINNCSLIIIFIDIPNITLNQISKIKSKAKVFQLFADIPEHYHSFYKYTQFLYDGLFIEEPEFLNFFEVFGLPTYDGSLFNNETAKISGNILSYDSLIPLQKRKYDFSFVGRLDRPGRKELISSLKKNFDNVYVYDSCRVKLGDEELNEIVKNTKYLFNSTSINPLNTFGFNKFPERYQLQRKSRVLEYAINGCIIFSEILPQKVYKTFSKETIPMIEVPRNVNQGEYCLSYLSRNNIDLDSLSRTSYIKVLQTYNFQNINLFFLQFLDQIKPEVKKLSMHNLKRKEIKSIKYHYVQWHLLQGVRAIINLKKPKFIKLQNLKKFIYSSLIVNRQISFLATLNIFLKIILIYLLKILKL